MPRSLPAGENITAERGDPGLRLVARVFGAGFGFLLVWTMGVHLGTFAALPFRWLYIAAAAALCGAVAGALWPAMSVFGSRALALPGLRIHPERINLPCAALLAGVFLVTAGLHYKASMVTPFWIACVIVAAAGLWWSRRAQPPFPVTLVPPGGGSAFAAPVFVAVALALLGFYFLTSVPDPDDSLFLNFAVGAKQAQAPLFTTDTMLGLPGLSFIKSTYRLESYQLLAALVSDLSGWPVLIVAHAVIPALICIWAASVLVLVHVLLFPRLFPLVLACHLLWLVALDGALQSYGYHAVPRFFQGKGPFVMVLVPLIAVLTLSALRQGSWLAVHLIAGAVVISLGLTANAVYAAPLAAALIALPHLFLGGAGRWRAFRLIEVILYPVALTALLLLTDPPGGSEFDRPEPIGAAMWVIMGSPPGLILGLGLLFAVAVMALANPALRWGGVWLLGFLCLVFNPLIWPAYGALTGNLNYRLFWAVPIPLMLAAGLGMIRAGGGPVARAVVLALPVLALFGPGSILHKAEIGLAAEKVPQAEFALARRVVDSLPASGLVLAPEAVSAWIPVIEQAPAVVEGRGLYIPQRLDPAAAGVLAERAELYLDWISADGGALPPDRFLSLTTSLGVSGIVLDTRLPGHMRQLAPLLAAGFTEAWRQGDILLLRKG